MGDLKESSWQVFLWKLIDGEVDLKPLDSEVLDLVILRKSAGFFENPVSEFDDGSVFFGDRDELIWADEAKLWVNESKKGFGGYDLVAGGIPDRLIEDLEVILFKTAGDRAFDLTFTLDEPEGKAVTDDDFLFEASVLSGEEVVELAWIFDVVRDFRNGDGPSW